MLELSRNGVRWCFAHLRLIFAESRGRQEPDMFSQSPAAPRRLLVSILLVVAATATGCNGVVDERPNELASAVTGPIRWDPKSQMVQVPKTKGCDSFTPTWTPDNHLYTAVGDCRPSIAPQKIGMGYGRISGSTAYRVSFTPIATGDPTNWDDAATGAGVEALGDGPASEKAAGMLHVDGRLWYWVRNISSVGTGVRLKFSADYGSANPQFTWASWTIPEVGYASFVQFGKGYAGGPAGYVYAVIPMRSNAAGSVSNSAYDPVPAFGLIRGARADLTSKTNWEYFCGSPSAPAWCPSPAQARSILYRSGKQFTPRAGMSWNPGLRKYMLSLVYDPDPGVPDDGTRFHGALMVLLSNNPWGFWQTVFTSGNKPWPGGPATTRCPLNAQWGAGERADIPTKYMSADGKTFYLFSSGGDCLSVARGVLP
jgi:hypothetical protein